MERITFEDSYLTLLRDTLPKVAVRRNYEHKTSSQIQDLVLTLHYGPDWQQLLEKPYHQTIPLPTLKLIVADLYSMLVTTPIYYKFATKYKEYNKEVLHAKSLLIIQEQIKESVQMKMNMQIKHQMNYNVLTLML